MMIKNIDKYNAIFDGKLNVDIQEPFLISKENIQNWDSLAHMELVVALEEEFLVSFNREDILDFQSYANGIELLRKKAINI